MALLFDAAGEYVNVGSGATLDDMADGTILAWVYCTNVATGGRIFQKGTAGTGTGYHLLGTIAATSGVSLEIDRATTDLMANAPGASLATWGANKWCFIGGVWNQAGANADQKVFHGDLGTYVAEAAAYTTQQVGAGAMTSNAGVDAYLGNNAAAGTTYFRGRIAWLGIWDSVLTLAQVGEQQFRPHVTAGCIGFWHLGANGVGTQADWSGTGSAGAVTNATVADHVPLTPWFGYDLPRFYRTTRIPLFMHHYRQQRMQNGA